VGLVLLVIGELQLGFSASEKSPHQFDHFPDLAQLYPKDASEA
jgi:hypothetical protein